MAHLAFFVDDYIHSKFKAAVGSRGMTKILIDFIDFKSYTEFHKILL